MITGISKGWCPEGFSVQYFTQASPNDAAGMRWLDAPTFEIPLYEDFNSPFWWQHSMAFEWGVDIVAIEISADMIKDNRTVACVNDRAYPKLYHFAGSDVFVLGYPFEKAKSKYPVSFPAWKRGSIASELVIPWNMRPAFLIDCRTSGGMSGSPAYSRVFGPAAHGDGTIHSNSISVSEFMGVYSGRLHDDENNASLGLVWHRSLIDAILNEPADGSRMWKPSDAPEMFSIYDK